MIAYLFFVGLCVFVEDGTTKEGAPKNERPQATVAEELKKMQGEWVVLEAGFDGAAIPKREHENARFVFKDDQLTYSFGKNAPSTGKIKLDLSAKIPHMDMVNEAGKVREALYLWEGDILKICFNRNGLRPSALTSKSGSNNTLLLLRRADKEAPKKDKQVEKP